VKETQPVPDMDITAAEDAAPSLIAALWQDLFQWRGVIAAVR